MTKRIFTLVAVVLILITAIFQINITYAKENDGVYDELSQIEDKKIGVITGSVQAIQAQEFFPDAQFYFYDTETDMLTALKNGKIDAFAHSEAIVRYMMTENPELTYIDENISGLMQAGAIFSKTKRGKALCDDYSEYILKIKENGLYDEIYDKWFEETASEQKVTDLDKLTGENGTLRIAIDEAMVPFAFIKDDQVAGMDIDIIVHYCEEKGYSLEINSMNFNSILPAVSSGKVDLACGGFAYTKERAQSVYFAEPTFEGGSVMAVLKADNSSGTKTPAYTLEDIKKPGTRIAVITGTELYEMAKKYFPDAEYMIYDTFADVFEALDSGKADAALGYESCDSYLKDGYENITYLPDSIEQLEYGFATQKNKKGEKICEEMNEYYGALIESGKFDELKDKWENSDGEQTIESYSYSGENGVLKVATTGLWSPMTYYVGDELTGFFVELIDGFCQEYGYTPSYETMVYPSELAGLAGGTYDVIADTMVITPERLEQMNITDPMFDADIYLFVPVAEHTEQSTGFFKSIAHSFIKNFVREQRWKLLLEGIKVTLLLSVFAGVIGTALGALICFLKMRRNKILNIIADIYIKIFRGIPIVVLLLVLNYLVFTGANFPAFIVCVIGFALDFSAYTSEMFRKGIEAVPQGQALAAKALGFGDFHGFCKVVFPQAMIHILPVYTGQFIALVKLTSVAGYISVMDLTRAADLIRSRTYEAFFPLILTAVIYLILSIILIAFLRLLEKKITPQTRKVSKVKGLLDAYKRGDIKPLDKAKNDFDENESNILYSVSHIMKKYENVMPIKDMTCEIRKGDVIAIIGPSGTGKSTFLNMLNQLQPADKGEILFKGENILADGYDLKNLRKRVGMVFQSFNLFSHLTIVENIMLSQVELLGRSKEEALCCSMDVLRQVGLTEKALNYPDELSGGQKQRVAIARQIAMDPEMILFDEPTSALDPTAIEEVLSVIRNLARRGTTMVIVTHEMNFARDVSNRVFYLDEGIIYEEGTPGEIFTEPKKEKTKMFIGHLKMISFKLNGADFDLGEAISKIEAFGHRYVIEHAITRRMLTIAEELGIAIIQEHFGEKTDAYLEFEYQDKTGKMRFRATYKGEEFDPVKQGDDISVALVKNALSDITFNYSEGTGVIEGIIN